MTLPTEPIYRSQNGDNWALFRGPSDRIMVRHEANPSSGGHVTEMTAEEFLSRGGSGPEYAAVRRHLAATPPAPGLPPDLPPEP